MGASTTPAVPVPSGEPSRVDHFQRRVVLAMVATVLVVTALGILDQRRAAQEALTELSHEQALLAQALAAGIRYRAAPMTSLGVAGITDAQLVDDRLRGAHPLNVAGERMVLLIRSDRSGLLGTDGRVFPSERLMQAFAAGESSSVLSRDEAVAFGLPRRMAVAGLAHLETGPNERWGLVSLSSAQRMRDRQRRADWRLGHDRCRAGRAHPPGDARVSGPGPGRRSLAGAH